MKSIIGGSIVVEDKGIDVRLTMGGATMTITLEEAKSLLNGLEQAIKQANIKKYGWRRKNKVKLPSGP